MPAILFICTANICRSPMAEAIMRKLVNERPDAKKWRVESAGTWGLDGYGPANRAQVVIGEMGLNISGHRARTVTRTMLHSFDLILTMESGHKEALNAEFPKISNRVWMLTEMIGNSKDIPDPIAGTLDDFRATARNLEQILTQGLETILEKATENSTHGK
jgi:protein-tyrosine-phosphatase